MTEDDRMGAVKLVCYISSGRASSGGRRVDGVQAQAGIMDVSALRDPNESLTERQDHAYELAAGKTLARKLVG